jgi:hypothetical protein
LTGDGFFAFPGDVRRGGIARAAFVGAALLAACSAFDASSDGDTPSPGADASVEGAALDANDGPDASTSADASEASSDATAPLCADAHWLCDDFDHPGPPGWQAYTVEAGTLDILSDAGPASPPALLRASAPPISVAQLMMTPPSSIAGLSCSFAMRVVQRDVAGAYVFDLLLPGTTTTYRLGLRLDTGATLFAELGVAGQLTSKSTSLPNGVWRAINVVLRPTSGQAVVTVGGKAVLAVAGATPSGPITGPTLLTFGPGSSVAAGTSTPAMIVDFDDVLCDTIAP